MVQGTCTRQRLMHPYGSGKIGTSYLSQIPTPSQESVNDSVTQAEPMHSTDSDMLDFINIPEEVLFQDYLFPPWMQTHSNDAKLLNTNSYYNTHIISVLFLSTTRH